MFVDACAIIAVLSDEPEAGRVSDAIASGKIFTSIRRRRRCSVLRVPAVGLWYRGGPIVPSSSTSAGSRSGSAACAETTRLALSAAHRYRPAAMASIRRLPALRLCEIFRGAHSGDGR